MPFNNSKFRFTNCARQHLASQEVNRVKVRHATALQAILKTLTNPPFRCSSPSSPILHESKFKHSKLISSGRKKEHQNKRSQHYALFNITPMPRFHCTSPTFSFTKYFSIKFIFSRSTM
jgi:hypothetical protein